MSGTIPILVEVVFDDFPEETGVKCQSTNDRSVIIDRPTGRFANMASFDKVINLPPGGSYECTLTDSFEDGFCCNYGNGSIAITALLPNQDNLVLARSKATFTNNLTIPFDVPDLPNATNPPIVKALGCKDDAIYTFLVNTSVGNKNCAWLSANPKFGWLCNRVDVAKLCHRTCSLCS